MGSIGPREIIWIALIIVLLFGAQRIPELMRSLGTGFREFKKGIQGDEETGPEKSEKVEKSEKIEEKSDR